jgi:hypothetical protein
MLTLTTVFEVVVDGKVHHQGGDPPDVDRKAAEGNEGPEVSRWLAGLY